MVFFIPLIELTCFLLGLFFLRNVNQAIWTAIKWFMLFTVITETTAGILGGIFHRHNLWLINIYTPVNFFIISSAFYRFLPRHKVNLLLLISGTVVFCISFFLELIDKGFFTYTSVSNTISDFFIFVVCNWFFYLLLKQDEWIEIHKHAAFWFVTGLFLFNFCAIVTDVFDNELMSLFVTANISLRYLLYLVFNLVLYGCWSFAFICKYQETI